MFPDGGTRCCLRALLHEIPGVVGKVTGRSFGNIPIPCGSTYFQLGAGFCSSSGHGVALVGVKSGNYPDLREIVNGRPNILSNKQWMQVKLSASGVFLSSLIKVDFVNIL